MSSVSISLGSPATSRCSASRSASLSCSHALRSRKRSTASRCIRTMKFSRFIAATSPCSSVVSDPASAASGSRSGVAWTWRQQLHPGAEEPGAERNAAAGLDAVGVLAEEVEVEAEVEDAEVLLVVVRPEQLRAQARAAPDHLPELDLRVDRLEEDQVRHLGHVDAGVEHVHRDRDVRRLVLLREVVEQALRILGVVVDDAREVPCVAAGSGG